MTEAYDVFGFFRLFPKRVTYLIAPDKRVRGVFHHELSAQKHVDEVKRLLAGG